MLDDPLPWLDAIVRATRPIRLPVVLSREEVGALLSEIQGTPRLVASILYGGGLRLLEALRLRVKDVDFAANLLLVREGMGGKDRRTMLPDSLRTALQAQVAEVRRLHARDVARGFGDVWLPDALSRKYPGAGREIAWQYVFPAARISIDPWSGVQRRHHLEESSVQRAVKDRRSGSTHRKGGRLPHLANTPSRRTCWRTATTSARSRNCWVMRT